MRVLGHRITHHAFLVAPSSKAMTVLLLLLVSLILFILSIFILYGIAPASGSVQPIRFNQTIPAQTVL